MDKASRDNRSNQLNPNNDAYHRSRGSKLFEDYDALDEIGTSSKFAPSVIHGKGADLVQYLQKNFPCFRFTALDAGSNAGVHIADCEENSPMGRSVQAVANGYARDRRLNSLFMVFSLR